MQINFGEALQEIRERACLSVDELAEQTRTSPNAIRNYECGTIEPTQGFLARFREATGVDLYVYAWCKHGEIDSLPEAVRTAATAITAAWDQKLASAFGSDK